MELTEEDACARKARPEHADLREVFVHDHALHTRPIRVVSLERLDSDRQSLSALVVDDCVLYLLPAAKKVIGHEREDRIAGGIGSVRRVNQQDFGELGEYLTNVQSLHIDARGDFLIHTTHAA